MRTFEVSRGVGSVEESWLLLLPDVLDDLLVDVGLLPSELVPEVIIYSVILSCGTKTDSLQVTTLVTT